MPIGIPKVLHKKYPSREYQWMDMFTKISQDRVLFLTHKLDSESMNQIIGILLYLKSENKDKIIFLYINCSSSDNSFKYGLSLIDRIFYVQNVETINFRTTISIVSLVRVSGKKGKRLALFNSRFRPCIFVKESFGQAIIIFQEVDEKSQLLDKIRFRYCKNGVIFQQYIFDVIEIDVSESEFFNLFCGAYTHVVMIFCLNNLIILNINQVKFYGLIDKIDKN